MAQYQAEVIWTRGEQDFLSKRYSRLHVWRFDGGVEVPASSSPHVVPLPMSDASAVDPEEAFIASLASCHMLTFLAIAVKHKYCVDHYRDHAIGVMEKNEHGKWFVSQVTLRPDIVFSGEQVPTKEAIDLMHQDAHEECFIANSVKTTVLCEPVYK